MKKIHHLVFFLSVCAAAVAWADAPAPVHTPQSEYENNIGAVVRNKIHYKSGHVEVQLAGGLLPYDSILSTFMAGGRFIWHISDHLGWEVIDGHMFFNKIGGFTTGLLQSKTNISNLQTPRLKFIASTNLLINPLYSKIHIGGRWDLFFDIYLALGVGLASVDTVQFASTGASTAPSETVLRSGFDPAFNVGLGFKTYLTGGIGLTLELRDYIVHAQTYNTKRLHSFYTTMVGLAFFIPSLG
ncbi:MAG: hypothetical protein KDD51_12040 [Bdellovibrionales bacterium]|nr:hypothetical protein [Bdellovibrionales bacterium]